MKPEEKKARGIVKQEVLALISSVIELLNVWGRPTTGQAIYMDAVMERIALEVLA